MRPIQAEIVSGTIQGKEFFFKNRTLHLFDGIYKEAIMVVGAEIHEPTYGNKMRFFAQAVRTLKIMFEDGNNQYQKGTLMYFSQAYTQKEITAVKQSIQRWEIEMIEITTVEDFINYINQSLYYNIPKTKNGKTDTKIYRRKIGRIDFYSHGMPSRITFTLGRIARNEDSPQTLSLSNVTKIKSDQFADNAEIYSFACRTGNASYEEDFGYFDVYYHQIVNDRYGITQKERFYTREKANSFIEGLDGSFPLCRKFVELYQSDRSPKDAHPEKSLAQKLADQTGATVHAFLTRTDYSGTWNDKGIKREESIEIVKKVFKDPSVKLLLLKPSSWNSVDDWKSLGKALWCPNGAYKPVKGGTTPLGLDNTIQPYAPKNISVKKQQSYA